MNIKSKPPSYGHLLAMLTILIWGTTFISTKILLKSFTPIEILVIRFLLGYMALLLLYPKRLCLQNKAQHGLLAAAGVSGITLYYLLENIALTLTTASNVGIIVTIAPFFTALLSGWFLKTEKPKRQFYIGFLIALIGVILISNNGRNTLQLNPLGDLLAFFAALTWAVYSILIRKISLLGFNTIQTTRAVFLYGLLLILPLLFFMDFSPKIGQLAVSVNLGNILFLGLGASALCFVTWNTAVGILGAVKTSVYIYLVPVVTVAAAALILKEPFTPTLVIGAALTLAGLWLSQTRIFDNKKTHRNNPACNRIQKPCDSLQKAPKSMPLPEERD